MTATNNNRPIPLSFFVRACVRAFMLHHLQECADMLIRSMAAARTFKRRVEAQVG